jgi:polysaccharide biosynthesis protein PslG
VGVLSLARTSLLACLLALVACASARADAPLPPDYFGMNVNRVLFDDPSVTHAVPLAAARAAGVTHGRIDFPWDAVQPSGPRVSSYSWTDKAVTALANQGIVPTPMLGYTAPWAAYMPGNTKSPPRNMADYAAFARLMALRYGPGGNFWRTHPAVPYLPIHRWEIWNEPNLPQIFWQSGRSPEAYARLYLAARAAIKAVDPSSQVIVGGMSSFDIPFVAEMFTTHPELHGQVDGLGIHPYATTVEGVIEAVRAFRLVLDAEGEPAVPMEVTEVGWQRAGNTPLTVPESSRAADMSDVTNALARSDCGIDSFEPYSWETAEKDPADGEDWYGMWSPTDGLLPSGQAYATATAQYASPEAKAAARSTYLLRICHPPASQLSVSVRAHGSRLRLQARSDNGGVKGAFVALQLVGKTRQRVVVVVSGSHGYVYYRPSRTIRRVSVTAAAYGFAASKPVQHRIVHAAAHKLPRR